MSAFEPKIQTRRCLLGGLVAILLVATSADAEVLVPFTPGNLLDPSVSVTVTNADGVYTYAYTIHLDGSDPAKQQKARKFVLELNGDVSNITSPPGWMFGQYSTEALFGWACVEAEPLAAGEEDDGNMPACLYSIPPGGTMAGFSFQSIHPPGDANHSVPFMIQGEKKWPVATSESDDLGPGADPDIRVDSVSGETVGPVPAQTCSGLNTDGAPCDDGYFCNGSDTCLSGSCSQHAGNPCTGKDDGDANCSEDCDEDNNNCSGYDDAGSPCPEDGNPCTEDYCSRGECIHAPANAGAVCLEQSGCQAESSCTGESIVCPLPSNLPTGANCADEGNPCTVDQCDASGNCTHIAGNAGAVCRAAQGGCDVPETCTGTSASCPADQFVSVGTACRASLGVCDSEEVCTGSSASCPADVFASSTVTCRAVAGICDVSEKCTGTSSSCPVDGLLASTSSCRASTGACDVQESCTGASAACPIDQFVSVGTVCRGSTSTCDVQEICSGSSASCPADAFASSTVTCRVAGGVCDVAETCTGTNATCPTNGLLPTTTVCRASAGACDGQERCTGTSAFCPVDQLTSAGTVCRTSSGICDVQESCTGTSASCPAEVFASSTTTCRTATGVCDVAEKCTGASASCPVDTLLPSTSSCRASGGICDIVERCNGTSATCPSDQFAGASLQCRAAQGACDTPETCSGSAATCPDNIGSICVPDCPDSPLDVALCDEFEKGELTLQSEAPEKRRLLFRGSDGPEIAAAELGNPQYQYDTTRYLFCAYNAGALISEIAVDPHGACERNEPNDVQCWSPELRNKIQYRDRARTPQNGLSTAVLNAKRRFRVGVKGRGANLQIPSDLGSLANSTSVEFQMIRTTGTQFARCWHANLPKADKSTATWFTAKSN